MPPRKLPDNDIVVNLYREGLSTGEIAERFNVAPVTVLSLLRRIGESRRSTSEAAAIRSASGRANPPSFWLGKKQPREMVERRIAKIRGDKHYLWKGGKDRRAYRTKVEKAVCNRCGAAKDLGIHHKDFDHYNDAPENLEVLCVSCHLSLHKTEYWKAIRRGEDPRKSNGPIGWHRQ